MYTADPIIHDVDEARVIEAQRLFLLTGQGLGLNAAYRAFERAAELEDCSEIVCSAAWQMVGRTIIIALSLPRDRRIDAPAEVAGLAFELSPVEADRQVAAIVDERAIFAAAPDVRPRTRRIANNLGVLLDAGRRGGSISTATVYNVAKILGGEVNALLDELDRLLSPGKSPPSGAQS